MKSSMINLLTTKRHLRIKTNALIVLFFNAHLYYFPFLFTEKINDMFCVFRENFENLYFSNFVNIFKRILKNLITDV